MTIANAGASPPLIWRRGEIIKPEVEGVPIGLLEDREYEQIELMLEPGDILLLHSDGVEDQINPAGEEFTRGRIVKLLKKHAAEAPKAIADAVIAALDAYRKKTAISDDQSVIVLRVNA
jgi:sigma-B regulation protein RsbU (phosphoserine phosphatase)